MSARRQCPDFADGVPVCPRCGAEDGAPHFNVHYGGGSFALCPEAYCECECPAMGGVCAADGVFEVVGGRRVCEFCAREHADAADGCEHAHRMLSGACTVCGDVAEPEADAPRWSSQAGLSSFGPWSSGGVTEP